jgi:hypothetical protein
MSLRARRQMTVVLVSSLRFEGGLCATPSRSMEVDSS